MEPPKSRPLSLKVDPIGVQPGLPSKTPVAPEYTPKKYPKRNAGCKTDLHSD